ncbi:glutamate decarboxylase 1, partial [Biomphalaria pfeifferi]
GKMDVEDLREKMSQSLREGKKIIMVNATCGTTVLGAFDPVAEIADLCEDHHVWLHVD